ncbi:hypothetical protein Q6344_06750 [Psychrobacter cibarius]|nr:hypothetical protein Q6344_06750 [Psychrobacter cibarius]
MTDVKQLPENLEQLEQLTEFKRVYKKYTADQMEDLLTEAEVDYLSADNKSELTWRLLDHQGFDFEAALAEANNDQPAPADDKDDTNEDVQTVQDDTDSEHGDQIDSEASADDSEKPSQMDNVTNDDVPSDIGNSDDANANEVEQPANEAVNDQRLGGNAWFQFRNNAMKTNDIKLADTVEEDHVEVFNTGAFAFFETATSTLAPAKKTTNIYPTALVDKDQILRNVKQYNHTRGNKLRVLN